MRKHNIVSLTINYFQHVWTIDSMGYFLDFSALCKCRLLALHKPFKLTDIASAGKTARKITKMLQSFGFN